MSLPYQRQVAVELLRLTEQHGMDSWVDPRLNSKPYSIVGVTKQQLPTAGTLCLTFLSKHRASCEALPLSDAEFDTLWQDMVDPRRLANAAAAVEHQLNLSSHAFGPLDSAVAARFQGTTAASDSKTHISGMAITGRQSCKSAKSAAVLAAMGVGSWYGASQVGAWGSTAAGSGKARGKGRAQGTSNGALEAGGAGSCHVHGITDGWKLQLLQVLIQDCFFTSTQARAIVKAFSYGEDKIDAAVKVFGCVVDPQNFSQQVYSIMAPWQVEQADNRIGCLKLFSPDNPTGKYSLLLSHPAQQLVAARLVELFCQQYNEGYCNFPHSVCFSHAALNEVGLTPDQLEEPSTIKLPKTGWLKVVTEDWCTPVALFGLGFAVLVGALVASSHLDGKALADAVDDADVKAKVSVVGRFDSWQTGHGPFTGKVSALRRLAADPGAVHVKDLTNFVEAMHLLAIHHYLMGTQLMELIKLLPETANNERVELCSSFWARLTDRATTWSDVMRSLTAEQQVAVAHRLGYANVFDAVRPAMHYRLRMWRADDHQIAWRLHRMALNAKQSCFENFAINGVPKKIAETANLWSVMRGSAAENEKPTVTLDFDFVWLDSLQPHWAAVTIQAAWRAYCSRRAHADAVEALVNARVKTASSRPETARCQSPATGVRANSTLKGESRLASAAGMLHFSRAGAVGASSLGTQGSVVIRPGSTASRPRSRAALEGGRPHAEWNLLLMDK
eukprot:gene4522-4774_t